MAAATTREAVATVSAIAVYLTTVLPRARRELRQLGPLPREKTENVEAVALLAILSPRSYRATAIRAIVSLQVAIDLRDRLEEAGGAVDPTAAVSLERLDANWRREIASLPAREVVEPFLEEAIERCEEGQRLTHAAAGGEIEPLRGWTERTGVPAGYRWWEVAAGASSSIAPHALIAAAADPGTSARDAAAIDAAYHPSIGSLTVLLDDLVDLEDDRGTGEHNYIGYYENLEEAAHCVGLIAGKAVALVERLPQAARHRVILAGVAAFYLGSTEIRSPLMRPIRQRLQSEVGVAARFLSGAIRLARLG